MFSFDDSNPTYTTLDDLGINHDDGSVIIQREIYRNGRNVCRVNGILVNTTNLKAIGNTIVDIQGQNEHQELMNTDKHVHLLDAFNSSKITPVLNKYRTYYLKYTKLNHMVQKKA